MLPALLLLLATVDDISGRLAGSDWREWTLHRFEMTMGSSGGCTSGQVDRFSSNHTVTIRECKAGHVVSTSETWRVSTDGDADTFLTIGNQRYHLFFKNRDGAEFMRLEIRPNVKTEIKDYDFKLTQSGTDK